MERRKTNPRPLTTDQCHMLKRTDRNAVLSGRSIRGSEKESSDRRDVDRQRRGSVLTLNKPIQHNGLLIVKKQAVRWTHGSSALQRAAKPIDGGQDPVGEGLAAERQ